MTSATIGVALRLAPDVHREANRMAAARSLSLSEWIRRAISEKLARDQPPAARQ
jgi:predicted HicB family RNase H-like nuclease